MKPEQRDRQFIGTGWAFPVQFSPRGRIALATGPHDVEQSIRIVLGTVPGERVMRPEFGCRAWELLFAPRNPATEGLLMAYIEQALGRWEPRIDVLSVEISDDLQNDGALIAEIRYEIKATHDERSIVYPFYILNEEEA
ncbi:MAG: GPW/gp25 family protein [Chloroflexi bacterium]|nr:GPW/gp25 family protein [Chloroflexota bacterium]